MLHIALFVDFDNVYLTLQEYDRDAATAFAADPGRWLAWLEQQIPRMHPTFQGRHCRLLVRRCYLNPSSFWEKRPFFIRSGFEVVDCPPLTNRGKTAADIQIVMDVLDTLQAPTHYDVFVILSADADFTPVLLRLRQHGRFTAMLAVGMVSPAYRAASDLVITQDDFVRHGLGINPPDDDPVYAIPSSVTDQLLLDRMAARLADAATPPEGIVAHELATIYKEFPEFRQSQNWLGFFTLQQLTRALIDRRDDLAFVDEDPWRVVRAESFPETGEARALPELAPASAGGPPQAELLTALSEWVVTTVRSAAYPVPIAVLEVQLNQRHPLATKHWLGHHTCESLLLHLDLDGLQFSSVAPGYLYDPEQHTPPREDGTAPPPRHGRSDAFAGTDDALARFARQINKLTDLPYLQPAHYAVLLTALAEEVNARGYHQTRTSKMVRDRCVEQGAPVARAHVNFILTGLSYAGHHFTQGQEHAAELAALLIQNIRTLCRTAQYTLDPEEERLLERWITDGLPGNISMPSEGDPLLNIEYH